MGLKKLLEVTDWIIYRNRVTLTSASTECASWSAATFAVVDWKSCKKPP